MKISLLEQSETFFRPYYNMETNLSQKWLLWCISNKGKYNPWLHFALLDILVNICKLICNMNVNQFLLTQNNKIFEKCKNA